jgi:hypothetical protein
MRFYTLAFKTPKPSFNKELGDYFSHLIGAHTLFFIIMFEQIRESNIQKYYSKIIFKNNIQK